LEKYTNTYLIGGLTGVDFLDYQGFSGHRFSKPTLIENN
jgi:hypothetical protein